MKCFGGGIQYIADEKELIFVRALGYIVEDSARQFIHEITSFQWDFTTETEGEQEGRRDGSESSNQWNGERNRRPCSGIARAAGARKEKKAGTYPVDQLY